jgi:uncharacterized protein YecT (DUF1311 family)
MLHAILLAAASNPCASANTQMDLDVCWEKQSELSSALLKDKYAQATAELKKVGIDPAILDGVEAKFVAMADATCAFEAMLSEGGSIQPMEESMCQLRTSDARIDRLTALISVLRTKGSVDPAAPVSAAADAELNRVYKLLRKQITEPQHQALRKSELLWIGYRDAACALEGGDCMTALEQGRTAELEAGWVGEQFW